MFTVLLAAGGSVKIKADSWDHVFWEDSQICSIESGFEFFTKGQSTAYFRANSVMGIVDGP